jgi:hypothetical protein
VNPPLSRRRNWIEPHADRVASDVR